MLINLFLNIKKTCNIICNIIYVITFHQSKSEMTGSFMRDDHVATLFVINLFNVEQSDIQTVKPKSFSLY